MDLSKELAKRARKYGICKEWHEQLKKLDDKDAMVEMYIRGIDFCLVNNYPDNDFIRANFKGVMEKQGVFLDDTICVKNKPKYVLLGACSGIIEVSDFNVCEIFIKNESKMTIVAKDNAFVMIDVFDNTTINIEAHNRAKVCVNHYGGKILFKTDDESVVKIREKNKKTY